jgi:hypothetical protein
MIPDDLKTMGLMGPEPFFSESFAFIFEKGLAFCLGSEKVVSKFFNLVLQLCIYLANC